MIEHTDIGERLYELREQRGWTQVRTAQEAGLSHATITHLETGKVEPRMPTLRKLARAFGVTVDELKTPLADESTEGEAVAGKGRSRRVGAPEAAPGRVLHAHAGTFRIVARRLRDDLAAEPSDLPALYATSLLASRGAQTLAETLIKKEVRGVDVDAEFFAMRDIYAALAEVESAVDAIRDAYRRRGEPEPEVGENIAVLDEYRRAG